MFLEKVVIGNSLGSINYAFHNEFYFIPSCSFRPFFFEVLDINSQFREIQEKQVFDEIKNTLSFLGMCLDFPTLQKIRISKNNIKIFDENLLASFKFGECFICDKSSVTFENEIHVAKPSTYLVVDDFKISRIGKNVEKIQKIETKDALVSKAYFYNSNRVDGARYITDAITVSNLTEKDLYEFDYSDTMAMFKLRNHLESMGYTGIREKTRYKNGNFKTKKIKLEHLHRQVFKQNNNVYFNTDLVKFINPGIKDFYNGSALQEQ